MHVHEISLINVRRFEQRTFQFQSGFNLLVGENGVGKSTLLRALLTVLGSRQQEKQAGLADEDIRYQSSSLEIRAQLLNDDGSYGGNAWHIRNSGSPPRRRRSRLMPRVISYTSNEATCSNFLSRRVKRYPSQPGQVTGIDPERAMYERSRQFAGRTDGQPNFGHSEELDGFLRRVLQSFLPEFKAFMWSFEPYSCTLRAPGNKWPELKSINQLKSVRRQVEGAIMRHLQMRGNPLQKIDKASVDISPQGNILTAEKEVNVVPEFVTLMDELKLSGREFAFIKECTAMVRLTPRIRVFTQSGESFLIRQLSDGQQRLFSLIVDIARQLSLDQANFDFAAAQAIILIDEIDVHLHPKWQRNLVPVLEDLFPACQFIATTHSPFIVQAVREHQLQDLDSGHPIVGRFSNRGIEEIAFKVMDIQDHQVNTRYLQMLDTAKEYFQLLAKARQSKRPTDISAVRGRLRELSHRYADNPAYQAYLETHTDLTLGPGELR